MLISHSLPCCLSELAAIVSRMASVYCCTYTTGLHLLLQHFPRIISTISTLPSQGSNLGLFLKIPVFSIMLSNRFHLLLASFTRANNAGMF